MRLFSNTFLRATAAAPAWPISRGVGSALCAGGVVLAVTARLWAANPGQEVVVVYNNRVPESKAIAEYYARQRQVPTNQLFGFELPTSEDISRADFETALQ